MKIKYAGEGRYSGDDNGVNILINSGASLEVSDSKAQYLLTTFPDQFQKIVELPDIELPPGGIEDSGLDLPEENKTEKIVETTNSEVVETSNSSVESSIIEETKEPENETNDQPENEVEDFEKEVKKLLR